MSIFSRDLLAQAVSGTRGVDPLSAETHSPEQKLLLAAGTASFRAAAGYQATQTDTPLPEKCPSDTGDYCPESALQFFTLLRRYSFYPELTVEWLEIIAEQQYRLPEEVLPVVLDARTPEQEIAFGRVLQQRGQWLGRQQRLPAFFEHPTDPIAISDDDWHSTNDNIRAIYFQHLRETDPAKARELLQESWQHLSFALQTRCIHILQTNLSLADEDFLETLLNGAHREIFRQILQMLYELPGTRLRERINRRIVHQVRLSQNNSTIYRAHADDVLIDTDKYTISLHEGIKLVPPAFWMQRWQIDAATLIQAALQSSHNTLFLHAWRNTATRQNDLAFLETYCYQYGDTLSFPVLRQIFSVLAPQVRCNLAQYWLKHSHRHPVYNNFAVQIWMHRADYCCDDVLMTAFIEQLHRLCQQTIRPLLQIEVRRFANKLRPFVPLHMSADFLRAIEQNQRPEMSDSELDILAEYHFFFAFRQQMHDAFEDSAQ